MQTTEKEDFTAQKILKLKSKIENPEITKSNQTMSTDSAVWYIEALLNFEHCIISNENTELVFDININDSSIIHNVENTTLNINVIKNYYSYFEKIMLDRYNKLENTNKFLYIADVEYKKNALTVNYGIKAISEEKSHTLPYIITDDWNWGFNLGNCSGTVKNIDLADKIRKWLTINRAVKANVYYTDINYIGRFSYTPWGYTGDRYYNVITIPTIFCADYIGDVHPHSKYYCIPEDSCDDFAQGANAMLDKIEAEFIDQNKDVAVWYYQEWTKTEPLGETHRNIIAHEILAYSGIINNKPDTEY